ncbi:hypothetical protein [Neisseria dentiae]|uniref:hypothetical protein n=1 Tax=Neisseria dentiae TaxID=194197 RepID=UPI0035A051E6
MTLKNIVFLLSAVASPILLGEPLQSAFSTHLAGGVIFILSIFAFLLLFIENRWIHLVQRDATYQENAQNTFLGKKITWWACLLFFIIGISYGVYLFFSYNPREELAKLNIEWTTEKFNEAIQEKDLDVIELFLKSKKEFDATTVKLAINSDDNKVIELLGEKHDLFDSKNCQSLLENPKNIKHPFKPEVAKTLKQLCNNSETKSYILQKISKTEKELKTWSRSIQDEQNIEICTIKYTREQLSKEYKALNPHNPLVPIPKCYYPYENYDLGKNHLISLVEYYPNIDKTELAEKVKTYCNDRVAKIEEHYKPCMDNTKRYLQYWKELNSLFNSKQ